jgi:cytochrome bd-type quinol oxidase subunit 2
MNTKPSCLVICLSTLLLLLTPITTQAQGVFQDIYDQANQAAGLKPAVTNDAGNSIINIIQLVLPYLFIIAGLILFLMIIHGGFIYLTSTTNPDKAEEAKKKITLSLTGFFIIFAAYWIAQALQVMLGIPILGGN